MILWLLLFGLVLALSFVLAVSSMRDFQDTSPKESEYGLFLIRKSQNLNKALLNFFQDSLKLGGIVSFERLFKGSKSALVVFGPKELIGAYPSLDLLELEDYTDVDLEQISAWEIGMQNGGQIFKSLPKLAEGEQFWWQIILSGYFQVQIRAVIVSADASRRKELSDRLVQLSNAFSDAQVFDAYKSRSFNKDNLSSLPAEKVLALLTI